MTSAASVGGDERLRLFLAYVLPAATAAALAGWAAAELEGRGRLVAERDLHVTLAFLGSRPVSDLSRVTDVLRGLAVGAGAPRFELVGWREARSAGMVVLRDTAGAAEPFARLLHERLAAEGLYRPERRPWLPHVTVLRYRGRPHAAPPLPQLPAFAPSDAAAFLSRLHPSGASYEVLESFSLGG